MRRTFLGIGVALACATYLVNTRSSNTTSAAPSPPSPSAPVVAPPAPPPVFATTEPAPAGSALRVFVDEDRLVGWLAGSTSFAGRTARIAFSGVAHEVPIAADNTFTFTYAVGATTEAVVEAAGLTQRATLRVKAPAEQAALLVVDRNAYRPGDKLSFAGYLRRGAAHAPIPKAAVEVHIDAEAKKTRAATLKLVSDEHGRISGAYTFSGGDPLDVYAISIPGYRGVARVQLAEHRKSRVKLDIAAALGDRAAVVDLSASDFLGAPVPGGSVELTAQIVRDTAAEPTGPLAPEAFAFGAPAGFLTPPAVLAYLADPDMRAGGAPYAVVAEVKGSVALDARGRGTHRIPLKSELARGDHRLVVEAVMTDANGRELRAHRTLPLARRDVRLTVTAPHDLVAAGTPVPITVSAVDARGVAVPVAASVVAIKATQPTGLDLDYGYLGNNVWNNTWNVPPNGVPYHRRYFRAALGGNAAMANACRLTGRCRSWQRRAARSAYGDATSAVAGMATVAGGAATIKLDDPGSYRVIASATLADGSTVWSEVGLAVREEASLPGVVVELDREQVRHGERITGRVESRYRDATALVLVRDGAGIRARTLVGLAGGRATFDIPAGTTLGYGAAVEAYLLGPDKEVLAAQQLFHVRPTQRELAVTATAVKKTYGPGDTVELDVSVGRAESVELAVSVFDQSLLGVAPDRAVDPRSFFHADDRLRGRAALATIAAQIGDVTVGSVLAEARAIATSPVPAEPELRTAREQASYLVEQWKQTSLSVAQLVGLLRHAGVQTSATGYGGTQLVIDGKTPIGRVRVVDLLAAQTGLVFRRIGDTVVIGERDGFLTEDVATFRGGYARGDASYAMGNASFSHAAPAMPALLTPTDGGTDMVRRDFSDSALWTVTRTAADGKARIRFKLPDSLTTWRVVVTALGADAAGRATSQLTTLRDVMVWPVLPRQFTEGDLVDIGGNVRNLSGVDREIAVTLRATNAELATGDAERTIRVPARSNATVTWRVRAKEAGFAQLRMTARDARSTDVYDASEKRIPVAPSAADQVQTASGFADKPVSLELPAGVDPRDVRLEVSFAPSLAADMVQTLD
ncbi:MAG: hypothetical protein KIT31_32815 [Deltaproteobacteria bacterium]|nr:hypothetical protein [Deltaproteobacteria bacterium]